MKTFPHPYSSGFSGGPCDLEQYLIANKHHKCVRARVGYFIILFILLEGKQHCITLDFFWKGLSVVVKLHMTAAVP